MMNTISFNAFSTVSYFGNSSPFEEFFPYMGNKFTEEDFEAWCEDQGFYNETSKTGERLAQWLFDGKSWAEIARDTGDVNVKRMQQQLQTPKINLLKHLRQLKEEGRFG